MRKTVLYLLLFSALTGVLSACGAGVNDFHEESAELKNISAEELTDDLDVAVCFDSQDISFDSVHGFSYELLKHNLDAENPVLSPVSAYLALAMVGNGAAGETLEEFHQLLGRNLTVIPYHMLEHLERDGDGMTIALANSAWMDDQLDAAQEYLTIVDSYFDAEVYQRELSDIQAMEDVNTWINAKTRGMIPAMIDEPLSEETRLVLFNTVYAKGKWVKAFQGYDTRPLDFTKENGEIVSAEMMQMFGENQLYVRNDVAEGVILPYQDDDMIFMALKPLENATVREMYEQLTWEQISEFAVQEETTLCNLRLPKFEISFDQKLNDCLKEMGLVQAFDSIRADLSAIGTSYDNGNLYISLVKQKAVIIVDEEGTEASAATMAEVKAEGAIEYVTPPVNLYFDKPFLYMILDREHYVPLFMGILDTPIS